jgi:hypothetical protein
MRFNCNGAVFCGALILAIPAAMAAPATATQSASPKAASKAPAVAKKPASDASAAMRAYIDPETGKLVSHPVTAEQKRAAQQAASRPAPVVQTIHHADGSVEDVLNGAADAVLTATVGKDGKIHMHCSDGTHDHGVAEALQSAEARDER